MKIRRSEVVILWNETEEGAVTKLAVIDREGMADSHENMDSDMGANCSSWLEERGMNPEAVFGQLIVAGFESSKILYEALKKFNTIEGCEWAGKIIEGVMLADPSLKD